MSPFLRTLCCGTSHLRSCVNAPDLPFASRNYPGARILFGGRTDCEGCSCRVPSGLAALGGLVNAPRAPRKVSTATLTRSDPKKSPPHPREPLKPVRTRPCAVFVAREAAACASSVVPPRLETRPRHRAGGTRRRYLDRCSGPAAPLEMLATLHDTGESDVPGHPEDSCVGIHGSSGRRSRDSGWSRDGLPNTPVALTSVQVECATVELGTALGTSLVRPPLRCPRQMTEDATGSRLDGSRAAGSAAPWSLERRGVDGLHSIVLRPVPCRRLHPDTDPPFPPAGPIGIPQMHPCVLTEPPKRRRKPYAGGRAVPRPRDDSRR